MNAGTLLLMCILLVFVVVVIVFLSVDGTHWRQELTRVRQHSKEPFKDLRFDTVDIMCGGALSAARLFGADAGAGAGAGAGIPD
jgi:hypothetical protein